MKLYMYISKNILLQLMESLTNAKEGSMILSSIPQIMSTFCFIWSVQV